MDTVPVNFEPSQTGVQRVRDDGFSVFRRLIQREKLRQLEKAVARSVNARNPLQAPPMELRTSYEKAFNQVINR